MGRLIEAVKSNNLKELLRLLVEEYKNSKLINEEQESKGWTSLHWAAWREYVDIIQALINAGADVNQADNDGFTPLFWAASNGCAAAIDVLVKARANVNQATMNGNTPLHIAAEKNQVVVIQPLLNAGANVTAEFTRGSNKGKTPLDIAKEKGHIEIVKLFEEHLLKESVQIEKEHYNWTALHRAVYNADVGRVKWLIANGAKIVKDSTGRYPHQVSTYEGLRNDPTYLKNRKIVEDLIVNPHKVNEIYILQESDKQLFEAVKTEDIEKINKALEEGANINATTFPLVFTEKPIAPSLPSEGPMPRLYSTHQWDWDTLLTHLRNNDTTLTRLYLNDNSIGDKEVKELSQALKANQILITLDLRNNDIGDSGAEDLSLALKDHPTLANLYLQNNHIGDKGTKNLSLALKENGILTILGLDDNHISDDGAKELSQALKENHALRILSLLNNRIGESGAKGLSEALKDNCTLTSLSLYGNHIGNNGAKNLSLVLTENYTLTDLNLAGNAIDDSRARDLSLMLKENHTLTVLHLAGNHIEKDLQQEIDQQLNANINLRNELNQAIKDQQIQTALQLLQQGVSVTAYLDDQNQGNTPLHQAVLTGCAELVQALAVYIKMQGVPLTLRNWQSQTAADLASLGSPIRQLLGSSSTNLTSISNANISSPSTVEGLIPRQVVNNKLFEAVKTGDIGKINKALKEGANINATEPVIDKNDGGYTPLHLATLKGDVAVVKHLLKRGAFIEGRNVSSQSTPLHQAAYMGHLDVLKLLVKNGANLEALDHTAFTPLHYAVYYNQPKAVEALLELGAELEAKTGAPHMLIVLEMAWSMHNNGQERKSIIEILTQFKALYESKLRYEALQAELTAFKNELDKVKAELIKLQQVKSQEVEQKPPSSIQNVTIQTSQLVILDTISGQQVSLSPDEKGEVNHQQHSNGNIASSKVSNKNYPEPLLPPLISIENLPLPTEALLKQFEAQSMTQQAKMLEQLDKEIQEVEGAVVEKGTFQEVLTEAAMEHNRKLPVQLAAASPDTQPTLKPKEDMAGVRAKISHEDTLAAIREGVKLKPVPKETLPQGKIKKLIDKSKDLKEIFEAALAAKFKNTNQDSDEENDNPDAKNDLLPQYASTLNRQDHKNLQPSTPSNTTSKQRNEGDEDKGFDNIDYAEKFGHK